MMLDKLHKATHRVPGVPAHADHPAAHADHPAGHQGATGHGRTHHHSSDHRLLPGWQRRIAELLSRTR